jgi:hypothetical protein
MPSDAVERDLRGLLRGLSRPSPRPQSENPRPLFEDGDFSSHERYACFRGAVHFARRTFRLGLTPRQMTLFERLPRTGAAVGGWSGDPVAAGGG